MNGYNQMQTPLHIQVYTVEECLGEKDDEMIIVPRHIASEVWAQFHPYPWVWLASNSEILLVERWNTDPLKQLYFSEDRVKENVDALRISEVT